MEFKELSFEQTQIRIIDGDRGKNYPKKSDLRQRGHTLFLNNKNIINNYLDDSFGEYISEEKSNLLRKGKLERGDLVISTRGSIGNVGYYSSDIRTENIRINSGMLIIRNFDNSIDTEYLYVLMRSNFMKQRYKERISGSVQNQLPIRDFKKIKIPIPDLHSQIIIKNVILTLDSKIEINNKIISNLESQAQAIFKSWFVDFEPFQDGNFVQRELGMIPEGWEVKPIGELLDFDIGGGWGKEKPQEKYLIPAYVIRGTDIPDSKFGYFNKDNYRYHTESNLKNRRLQVGDIIFESSGGSTNQDLGRMLMVTDELLNEYNNDVICASFCKLIRINDSSVRWFVYNLLEYSYRNKILTKYEVKSTGISNFSFTIFKDDFKIAVPDRKTIERYFNVTGNNINLSAKLGIQNTKLTELRDALLPKLMAGEIDVSNIKIEGEEVKNE